MNEDIGAKGGRNDRRRTRIIEKSKKKKEELELEKDVKKKQFYTLIKTLPLIIGTAPIYTFKDAFKKITKKEEKEDHKNEPIEEQPIPKQGEKKETESPKDVSLEEWEIEEKPVKSKTGEVIVVRVPISKKKVIEELPTLFPEKTEETLPKKKTEIREKQIITEKKQELPKKEEIEKEEVVESGASYDESFIKKEELTDLNILDLPEEIQPKLERLKSRKIVEEYENNLKDIRYDLRKTIYEYEVLKEEEEEVVLSKEAEVILDRLSDVIDKLEELKRKIKVDQLDKYDDNYIYYLIENYFDEFKNGKVIKEIKDSPLYIMIEEKIEEMNHKKEGLYKSVANKKEKLEQKEKSFEELQKKYSSIEKVNQQLLSFQYDQEKLLEEVREKVKNAETIKERSQVEINGLTRQSRNLLRLLTLQMLLRGSKNAKAVAASTAAYLYFVNHVVKPNTKTRRYRVITVKDYQDVIKDSIEEISSAQKLLSSTSSQIDKIMKELKEKYKDYIGVVPEWDELFYNLKKVKQEIEEKEYEMVKLKSAQEKELEKNNAKVKTMGEYPVN